MTILQTLHEKADLQPEQHGNDSLIGYWNQTWCTCTPPSGANAGIAFSGWADTTQALLSSNPVAAQLQGTPYICFGGGNSNGAFTPEVLEEINSAIQSGQCTAFKGIAYDVEEGDSGLESAFAQSFAIAKAAGLKVLVTVSHSAPYGITDAASLMQSFFANEDIDYLSPQLYTTGTESENNWETSAGVTWDEYATAKAAIVPSIVYASYYANAQETFASYGVTTGGYVVWNCY
ncbi:hypothetical protein NAC44_06770 [Allorhizobium sp. BGMRC 0089]|uniref:hypothetical protein n=1 Tax=Allorhizobium sonneratiae TaxID=2934936 RepID=UPI002033948C|nr:hypothetical protein [Allorhizobium sonneratiae]MCM2292032.1 hypothetical protein [Allorhizobium sonneratiae]